MKFKHILVPTDFGHASQAAIDAALSLASAFDADVTLLHVWEVPVYPYMEFMLASTELTASVEQAASKRLAQEVERVQKQLPRTKSSLKMGPPWQTIIEAYQDLHADLIVVGTHGRQGLNHLVLGSVAEKVVRFSKVPVLTIHPDKPA